jgi:hypothetical protein
VREHDPEKACRALYAGWVPVFGKSSCSKKKLERDDDSKKRHTALGAAFIMMLLGCVLADVSYADAAEIVYEFRSQPAGARAWLARNFELKLDAANTARVRLDLDDRGLTIETIGPAEPLLARSNLNVSQPARLTITWGVNRYPVDANWDTGANNEAIMVMVFFGTEKLPGGLFVPSSPYFIGFFLCERGRRGVALAGRSYTRQGRYVCVDGPEPGKEITTTVALDEQFRSAFRNSAAPPVTGLAIEADTTQVGANARSSAWVKSVKIAPVH